VTVRLKAFRLKAEATWSGARRSILGYGSLHAGLWFALHTIDGTIPQLRRALDRSLDAYFEFLPGASDEDKRDFDDS
jgi:hypothetical protein